MRTAILLFLLIFCLSALARDNSLCYKIREYARTCPAGWGVLSTSKNLGALYSGIGDMDVQTGTLIKFANDRRDATDIVDCGDGGKADRSLGQCIWKRVQEENLADKLTPQARELLERINLASK